MNFKTYRIADLLDEIAMGPFGSDIKVECFVSSGIPVLNGSNLGGFKLQEDTFRFVTEQKADQLKNANARKGDIVITHRGTLGQISYIPDDAKYERYVISQSQFRIRCNHLVMPEFLVFYFHTREGQSKLLANTSQVGVPALSRPTSTFREIELDIPDIPEQKRVCETINSICDKIELNNRIIANLVAQAQAIFTEIFQDDDSAIELGEVCATTSGGTPSRTHPEYFGGNIPWVKSKELNSSFLLSTEETVTNEAIAASSAKILPLHSVLIAMYGATVGEYCVITTEMACNQAICAIIPNAVYPYEYLFQVAKNNRDNLRSLAIGSAQQNINQQTIKNLIVSSDTSKIASFHDITRPIFACIENRCKESIALIETRDTLLPKLMSGEIEVPVEG